MIPEIFALNVKFFSVLSRNYGIEVLEAEQVDENKQNEWLGTG